uniref:NAC domain-containing protein n=1 Tax=Oryza punctata TaxID=4537 RepID=A0A0E0JXA8_ORYPU
MAMYGSDHDRYFFTMATREAQASRRTTPSGFWKPTGTKKTIFVVAGAHEVPTAVKRRFVFHLGHHQQPLGDNNKTPWIMHEYRLINPPRAAAAVAPPSSPVNTIAAMEEIVLCRISNKDLPKPPCLSLHNGLLQFSSVGLSGDDAYNYLILDLEPLAMEYPNVDIGNVDDDAAAATDDPGDLDEEVDSMPRNHGG